jgi:hypothetical protein
VANQITDTRCNGNKYNCIVQMRTIITSSCRVRYMLVLVVCVYACFVLYTHYKGSSARYGSSSVSYLSSKRPPEVTHMQKRIQTLPLSARVPLSRQPMLGMDEFGLPIYLKSSGIVCLLIVYHLLHIFISY